MSEEKISLEVQRIIDEIRGTIIGREKEVAIIREKILSFFPEIEEAPGGASWMILLFVLLVFLMEKISPIGRKEIGYIEVRELLKKALGEDCEFMELDMKYYVPYWNECIEFLKEDKADFEYYVKETYDCDKFARRLWGNLAMGPTAIKKYRESGKAWADTTWGLSWSRIHMYLMLVVQSPDGSTNLVRITEPQNDLLHDPEELKDIQVPCVKRNFGGKDFWIPEWQAFKIVKQRVGKSHAVATPIEDGTIKLKRARPFFAAEVKDEEKSKDSISLSPYKTIRVMM